MIRIAVLGNSHVAALKYAWDALAKDFPDVSVTFFADRERGIDGLKVSHGRLRAGTEALSEALRFTSGGADEVRPEKYDVFLVYGGNAKPNFRNPSFFYTRNVLELAHRDLVEGTLSFRTLHKLRKITERRIYIGHVPLPAAPAEIDAVEPCEHYLTGIDEINRSVYQPLNAHLVCQPTETIVGGRYTANGYSVGSRRLAVGRKNDGRSHPDSDDRHMNRDFGEKWMRSFFATVLDGTVSDGKP